MTATGAKEQMLRTSLSVMTGSAAAAVDERSFETLRQKNTARSSTVNFVDSIVAEASAYR